MRKTGTNGRSCRLENTMLSSIQPLVQAAKSFWICCIL